jgi:hypothetical protein
MFKLLFGSIVLLAVILIAGADAESSPRKRELSYEEYVNVTSASNAEVVLNVSTKNTTARNATAP